MTSSASEHGDHDVGILRPIHQAQVSPSSERLAEQFSRLDQGIRRIAEPVGHRKVEEHGQRLVSSSCDTATSGYEADNKAREYATATQIAHLRSAPRKL